MEKQREKGEEERFRATTVAVCRCRRPWCRSSFDFWLGIIFSPCFCHQLLDPSLSMMDIWYIIYHVGHRLEWRSGHNGVDRRDVEKRKEGRSGSLGGWSSCSLRLP